MKEIYTSNHMWKLFENFLVDICRVSHNVCVTLRDLMHSGAYIQQAVHLSPTFRKCDPVAVRHANVLFVPA